MKNVEIKMAKFEEGKTYFANGAVSAITITVIKRTAKMIQIESDDTIYVTNKRYKISENSHGEFIKLGFHAGAEWIYAVNEYNADAKAIDEQNKKAFQQRVAKMQEAYDKAWREEIMSTPLVSNEALEVATNAEIELANAEEVADEPIIKERDDARNEFDVLNQVRKVIEKDCERYERLRDRCKSGSPKRKEYSQLLADFDPIIRTFGDKFAAARDRYNKALTLRTDEERAATQKAVDKYNADLDARGINYFATVYYYPHGIEGEDMEIFYKDCKTYKEAAEFVSQEDIEGVYVGGIYDAGWKITDRNDNVIADHNTGIKEEPQMTIEIPAEGMHQIIIGDDTVKFFNGGFHSVFSTKYHMAIVRDLVGCRSYCIYNDGDTEVHNVREHAVSYDNFIETLHQRGNREKLLALRKDYIITGRLSENNSHMWYVNGKRSSQVKVWNLLRSYGLVIEEFLAENKAYINEQIAASCRQIAIEDQAEFLKLKITRDAQPCDDNDDVFSLIPDVSELNSVEDEPTPANTLTADIAKYQAAFDTARQISIRAGSGVCKINGEQIWFNYGNLRSISSEGYRAEITFNNSRKRFRYRGVVIKRADFLDAMNKEVIADEQKEIFAEFKQDYQSTDTGYFIVRIFPTFANGKSLTFSTTTDDFNHALNIINQFKTLNLRFTGLISRNIPCGEEYFRHNLRGDETINPPEIDNRPAETNEGEPINIFDGGIAEYLKHNINWAKNTLATMTGDTFTDNIGETFTRNQLEQYIVGWQNELAALERKITKPTEHTADSVMSALEIVNPIIGDKKLTRDVNTEDFQSYSGDDLRLNIFLENGNHTAVSLASGEQLIKVVRINPTKKQLRDSLKRAMEIAKANRLAARRNHDIKAENYEYELYTICQKALKEVA